MPGLSAWQAEIVRPPINASRYCFQVDEDQRRATLTVMVGDSLWERHATWWQEGFTDGADPEYEEQILPLIGNLLHGARRVLDVAYCPLKRLNRLGCRKPSSIQRLDLYTETV